jgi:hypothetical protein
MDGIVGCTMAIGKTILESNHLISLGSRIDMETIFTTKQIPSLVCVK